MNTLECTTQLQKETDTSTVMFPFTVVSSFLKAAATVLKSELIILFFPLWFNLIHSPNSFKLCFCILYKWTHTVSIFPALYLSVCDLLFFHSILFWVHAHIMRAILPSFLFLCSIPLYTRTCELLGNSSLAFFYKQSCYLFPGIHVQEFSPSCSN